MKLTLRLAVIWALWLTFQAAAWAAPTVGTITNGAAPAVSRNNATTVITALRATGGTPTGYRFTALPPAASGTLLIRSAASTAYITAAINTVYTPTQAANIAFRAPTNATLGAVSFTFQAEDATGSSANGTYNLTVSQALPIAVNKGAPIIPKTYGATAIKALQAADPDGSIAKYRILTIPASGMLRVGTAAITVATDVALADAGALTYQPNAAAAAGNYSFTYQAIDDTGAPGNAASFSLPVSNADCSQNSAVDFSERTVGESWKAQAGVTVGNTTVTTSKYTSTVPAGETNALEISNQPARLSTQGLVWQLNDQNTSGTDRSTVEMNFSRPVRNLAFSMEDIDISTMASGGSDFVDRVTFNAYTLGSNTPYQLTAADVALGSNNTNSFNAATNTITGTAANSGPAGTVVLTYPAGVAISRLEIIYLNTQPFTAGNLRLQTIGIPSMVWCAEVDLATTLTGPARS